MSVQIIIDPSEVVASLTQMLGRIDHFKRVDVGMGLSDFQTQDMHRHRPFTMRSRAKGMATTKIRQHSLYEMMRSGRFRARVAKRFAKTVHISPTVAREYLRYSTRPILRAEMYAVLGERLIRLRDDEITWEKHGG